jgi:hypothetical protein
MDRSVELTCVQVGAGAASVLNTGRFILDDASEICFQFRHAIKTVLAAPFFMHAVGRRICQLLGDIISSLPYRRRMASHDLRRVFDASNPSFSISNAASRRRPFSDKES